MRAKKFLRAWLEVAIEGRSERPVKAKKTEGEGEAKETAVVVATPTVTTKSTEPSESGSSVRQQRTRTVTSVADVQARLWSAANTPPQKVVRVIDMETASESGESVDATDTKTTTTRTTTVATMTTMSVISPAPAPIGELAVALAPTPAPAASAPAPAASSPAPAGPVGELPKQKAVIRRRTIVAKRSDEANDGEAVVVTKVNSSANADSSQKAPPPAKPAVVEVIPTAQATSAASSLSTTSSSPLSMTIIVLILGVALVGMVTLVGMVFGFSLSTDGSSIAMLSEAQRNVTILARASAAQRRELEACRTFGGGVPDASQNAAIASAEAKVSDSIVRILDLEAKLSSAQAEKAAAQSAQKLAEGRLLRLGSLAMDKIQISEALDKMTTRATFCETTSSQALKLSKSRDIAVSRAEIAENLISSLKLQVNEYSSGLQSAQKSLQDTVEVANSCRSKIGLPPYVPKHKSRLGAFAATALGSIPGLSDFFSFSAIVFYFVVSYAYYLRVMVKELVVERDTLVTHLAKLNIEGPVKKSAKPSREEEIARAAAEAARNSTKRARSTDDLTVDRTATGKKTAAVKPSEIVEEEPSTSSSAMTSANLERHVAATTKSAPANAIAANTVAAAKKKEDDEQSERSIRLVERWVEKSKDEEIKDELERIRRMVALEDQREKAAEEAQLEALREKARRAEGTHV